MRGWGNAPLGVLSALAVAAALVVVPGALADEKPGGQPAPEWDGKTLLVKFKTSDRGSQDVQQEGDEIAGVTATKVTIVKAKRGANLEERIAAYRARAGVLFAEPNYVAHATLAAPADPSYSSQWAFPKIQAPEGWTLYPGSYAPAAPGVPLAVIDTGVDSTHPDLTGRVNTAAGANCVNATDVCNGGPALDDQGHGTHVAGIAGAATANGVGVAGMAFSSPIIPVKVLDASGSGTYGAITNGILWAAQKGARVINLSLGGSGFSQTLCDAVATAESTYGVLVVAAAGNSGTSAPSYPAACPGAVGVAATDSNDGSPSWSNFGAQNVFISAPGASIYSTCVASTSTCGSSAYASLSGTSMASPFVAGLAAMLFSQPMTRTVADVKNVLKTTSQRVGGVTYGPDPAGTCGACWHDWYGYGRINVLQALSAAGGTPPPPPPPTVLPTITALSLNPTSVTGATTSQGTVTLSGPAPTGGAVVTLTSSATSVATVPANVTVAAGATTAGFAVTSKTVAVTATSTIAGSYGGTSQSSQLTVNPPAAATFTLAASPTTRSVRRGRSTTYAISISWSQGTRGPVSLSLATPVPAGVTGSFNPASTSTTSTLTVRAAASTVRGTYRLTVRSTRGGVIKTVAITLQVT